MTHVLGVDAWRNGWVVIALRDGLFTEARTLESFAGLLDAFPGADVIAIDIPIGLPPPYPRAADETARVFISPHTSRVFSTYPRPVYEALTHAQATAISVQLTGVGISQQSWRLGPRILEVAELLEERVFEVHPEVSFRELARRPLGSKKTWRGQTDRREALASAGIRIPADIGEAGLIPADDVLDAAAAAWSADRIARCKHSSLPASPSVESFGRPVAIWY